ncbi:16S rRNA (guanine(527)-N(7))-methyltransferase RsmG [Persicobacter psychrovividus]|uniref:Ribosomal RNA small subunit methyltransferase G n=1 Tax=Persicobacter psychrovividus TaxID=387638 RepID=A0ABM7VAY0_9BACT|nr:ribosomal RNA small subunit methyltransferase G [Persicobacter psychrovividus]
MEHTVDIIFKYFPDLTEKQKEQFTQLKDLYYEWNAQINVISRKDIEELYVRHVLHSLAIAKVMAFRPGADVLDVGTGGGFPGIPLAIMFPEANFHLIDSIGKKITVVQNVAKALGLTNVKAEQVRAEKVKTKYDFVVSRAVTRIKPFFNWIRTHFKEESKHTLFNGILYLKGGDLTEEMKELGRPYDEYQIPDFFSEAFFETKKVIYIEVE